LKDNGVTDNANSAILNKTLEYAFDLAPVSPEFFIFTYQENMKPTETEAWLRKHGLPTEPEYALVGHHNRHALSTNVKKFHGSSGVMVFHKVHGTDIQVGETYQSGTRHIARGKNDEKGMTAVPVNILGKKLCFGSAHLEPGTWNKKNNTRTEHFNKYATQLMLGRNEEDTLKHDTDLCDAAWFGGDFNWRNGGWKGTDDEGIAREHEKGVHSHFTAEGVTEYFASLNLGDTAFYQARPKGIANLPAALVTEHDERQFRSTGWLEGPGEVSTELLNYPPTFQPAKCPKGGVDDSLAGNKRTVKDGDKEPVCLKTASGGNCDDAICLSGQRPLAFTDAIYHKSLSSNRVRIKSLSYGPVLMPLASDHFPMMGIWQVELNNS